ncbi:MAG: hypothetical protein KBD01_13405 [Acidobacteria bacterium]|nr:hypothetical protein [Acidobacteriota bacterium]
MTRSLCLAAALTLACAALLPALGETDAANGGTIRVAANYHAGGADSTQQRKVAQTHDLVVLGTGWGDSGPPAAYDAANPRLVELEYQSWFDTGPGAPDYEYISANHEDWFYHDADGHRVATYSTHEDEGCDPARCPADPAYCNCRFGLNLGSAGLRDYVSTRLLDLVTAGGAWGSQRAFDGIFLDNTFPSWPYRSAKVQSGWVSATPVIGGTTQTESMWIADQQGFLAAMKAAIGSGKVLLFNGCFASSSSPSWQQNSYAFLEHADGCTMEDWVVTGAGSAATSKTGSSWQQDVDLFAGVNERGKWSTPLMGSGAHSAGVNRYAIATALLTWTGPRSCMNFWKGTAEEAIADRFDQTFPEAAVDLGSPLGAYSKLPNGVASRSFSLGRVLVNSTASQQTVALDEPMQTLEGQTLTSVTLASGRAEILLNTGGTGAPPADVRDLHRTDTR